MFSVVILTLNESRALPECLRSLTACDDLIVLDSGSTDDTIKIAESFGAKVFLHPFESFGRQRQWAMENIPFRYNWVLFLDADEYATPQFIEEVRTTLEKNTSAGSPVAAYDCCWKLLLEGQWMRYCDGYPRYQTRLVCRGRATWGDWGHGQKLATCDGAREKITEPYLHDAYIHGWAEWWKKHERYAKQEAAALASTGSVDRATALKKSLRKIPLWPFLFFVSRYIFGLGFLEGRRGFTFCYNRAKFEALVVKNYRDLRRSQV